MRSLRRRVVSALPWGRDGAAACPREEVVRADWRAIVARGTGAPPAPEPAARRPVRHPAHRRERRHPAASTLVAVTLGLTLVGQAAALVAAPAPVTAAATVAAAIQPQPGPGAVRIAKPPVRRAAKPERLRIARIGVRTPLVPLHVQRDGTLATPDDFAVAGWYRDGSRPGERGPAVLVGHVDSKTGPAVFFRLHELVRGDLVEVRRADGTLVRYAVRSVRRYEKSEFPTKAVYGATARPTLRLVTCGGPFDRAARSYRDNVVVYADLVPPTVHPRSST